MGIPAESEPLIRFERFELDLRTRELRANGRKLILQEQPFEILAALLERPGHLVTREELRQRLWSSDTFVDFEGGLNKAVNRLREVLDDSADQPRLIQTLHRQGYRFIALVEREETEGRSVAGSLAGKKVSHYRVLDILGGGGMGVVYKAEDLKLGRRVALKFLPEELGKDAKALERFEREARAASALDHPNICAIHEFGEHDGQPFMVMPLLEGQTLRDRIAARAAHATDKVVDLAIQIARGLEAAHQKGIIHRDIKPANILVTDGGEAKILDFGLAKLTHATDPEFLRDEEVPAGHVTHLTLTRTGVALGTAAYMSPEQVRGEKLDARTDLFSFGLVLYEAATGQQAFSGVTVAALHEAILCNIPVTVREINPKIPLKLEQIINKALQKDRNARYQSAAEMCADLRILQAAQQTAPLRRRWLATTVLGLVVAVAAVAWLTRRQPSAPPTGIPELKQRQLTANSSENAVSSGAISPDGKYLAYADLNGIHIKLIETSDTADVPQPDELKGEQVNWGIVPTWLPDGTRFIAVAEAQNRPRSAWAVPVLGGPPRKLRDDATAIAVSRDGTWVAFTTKPGHTGFDREMWLMKPDGSEARKLFEVDENSGFLGAESSPDGQRLAYYDRRDMQNDVRNSIEIRELRGGSAVTMTEASTVEDFSWSPDGRMIYSLREAGPTQQSCNYWATRIDLRTGKPLENSKRLTNWAGFCMDSTSATADGKRLAFRKNSWGGSVYVADLEDDGRRISLPKRLTLNEGQNYPATWTADSKTVVFTSDRDGQWRILKQSLNRDTAELVATGTIGDWNAHPAISPDGAWIIFVAPSNEESLRSFQGIDLMRVPIKGGRPALIMTARMNRGPACSRWPSNLCMVAELTTDHKQLIFTAFDPLRGRGPELTRLDIDPATLDYIWDLSPDGTRIAIVGYSEKQIHIIPLGGQQPREVTVTGPSSLLSVKWTADGKGLFASGLTQGGSVLLQVDLQGNAHVIWEKKGITGPLNAPPWNGPASGGWIGYPSAAWAVPSPDGRHLAIYDWNLTSNMWMMENF
jgi:serine/threonine protein kinase